MQFKPHLAPHKLPVVLAQVFPYGLARILFAACALAHDADEAAAAAAQRAAERKARVQVLQVAPVGGVRRRGVCTHTAACPTAPSQQGRRSWPTCWLIGSLAACYCSCAYSHAPALAEILAAEDLYTHLVTWCAMLREAQRYQ